jgi:hypothetical protein
MKYIFLFFLIIGCSENNNSYFPLEKIKSWTYKVEIQPQVEKKTIYKKVNLSLGKKKIKIDGEKKKIFPLLREDGSVFYYATDKKGIYRNGLAFAKDQSIKFEKEKRIVLPLPLDIGKKWNVESKTYLILKRYPYYDYRATTNFQIDYEIISKKEIVSTSLGKFKNCLFIKGEGETKFIGDSEIGSIKIKIISKEWYAKGIGLIKSERIEQTDSDLFGTTKMTQILEDYRK